MILINFTTFLITTTIPWIIYRIIINKNNLYFNFLRELVLSIFFVYFLYIINFSFFTNTYLSIDFKFYKPIDFIEPLNLLTNNFNNSILYGLFPMFLKFIPLGLFIPILFQKSNRLKSIILYSSIISFFIELAQYTLSISSFNIFTFIIRIISAITGFILINFLILILEKTNNIYIINEIHKKNYNNLFFLTFKFLTLALSPFIITMFIIIYFSSTNNNLSDKDFITTVFNESYNYDNHVDTLLFFDKKFFLSSYDDHLTLKIADMVSNNRSVYSDIHRLDLSNSKFNYSIVLLENTNNETAVIVYGKNTNAHSITINYLDEEYTSFLSENSAFIRAFPSYKQLDSDTDINNVFTGSYSKDLKVTFTYKDTTIFSNY